MRADICVCGNPFFLPSSLTLGLINSVPVSWLYFICNFRARCGFLEGGCDGAQCLCLVTRRLLTQQGRLLYLPYRLCLGHGCFGPYIISNSQCCFLKSNNPRLHSHYHKSFCNPTPLVVLAADWAIQVTVVVELLGYSIPDSKKCFSSLPGEDIDTTGLLDCDVFLNFHLKMVWVRGQRVSELSKASTSHPEGSTIFSLQASSKSQTLKRQIWGGGRDHLNRPSHGACWHLSLPPSLL
jgi:hypothetical protein